MPNGGVQTILDPHPNETVTINGKGYRPATRVPGSCAVAPAQSASFDRAQLSAADLTLYGLPPRPTGAGATPAHLASWQEAVRASTHRVCTSRTVFDAQTGQGVMADTNAIQAGNIDNRQTYTDVSANWYTPSVSSSNNNTTSAVWTGLGDLPPAQNLKQGGTEQDMGVWGDQHYYIWTENYPSQSEQWDFDIHANDYFYSETTRPIARSCRISPVDGTSETALGQTPALATRTSLRRT